MEEKAGKREELIERVTKEAENETEKERKVTIRRVAEKAGVSVTTVSFILNGITDKCSKETLQKVLHTINILDYHPSRFAQCFARGKSDNVILLADKHETVLQQAESFQFVRMLGKGLEKIGLNLVIRTYLEAVRIDRADAIICAGTEEETFRKIAAENFVPLLAVGSRIHDELFFQVLQDFEKVMAAGKEAFGNDFSVVLVDMYSESCKKEIRGICGDVTFLSDHGLANVPKGNIVTVNESLMNLPELSDRAKILVPSVTEARIDAVLDCYSKAVKRETVSTHVVRL